MTRLMLAATLACAACTPMPAAKTPPPAEAAPATGAQCDATAVQNLIGQPADAATIERARVGSGARAVRSFGPGEAVTMDFRPDRLNVERGSDGRIVRLSCG